jgi:hypothetical protein
LEGGDAVKSPAAAAEDKLESNEVEGGLVKSSGTGALGDEVEDAEADAVGACAVVRVGSLVVLPVACQSLLMTEPPSLQGEARESRAGQDVAQDMLAGQDVAHDMLAGPLPPGLVLG